MSPVRQAGRAAPDWFISSLVSACRRIATSGEGRRRSSLDRRHHSSSYTRIRLHLIVNAPGTRYRRQQAQHEPNAHVRAAFRLSERYPVSMLNTTAGLIGAGIIGRLASASVRSEAEQDTLLNVVGSVGAFAAGLMLPPLLGIGTISEGSPMPSRVDGSAAGRPDSCGSVLRTCRCGAVR